MFKKVTKKVGKRTRAAVFEEAHSEGESEKKEK